MIRANQRIWLFLVVVFCLTGCAGGIRLFENKIRIDRLNPSRGATDIPINQVVSFRVKPVEAHCYWKVWYNESGREYTLHPEYWIERSWSTNKTTYFLRIREGLKPYTRYYVWVKASAYGWDDNVVDKWWFKTGSWVDSKQVEEMDEEVESEQTDK